MDSGGRVFKALGVLLVNRCFARRVYAQLVQPPVLILLRHIDDADTDIAAHGLLSRKGKVLPHTFLAAGVVLVAVIIPDHTVCVGIQILQAVADIHLIFLLGIVLRRAIPEAYDQKAVDRHILLKQIIGDSDRYIFIIRSGK